MTPRLRSGPAPSVAAAMMPGPAPVTTIQAASARRLARSRAWTYSGSVVRVRAEPNTVTLRTSAYGANSRYAVRISLQRVAGDLEVEPVGAVGAEVEDGAVDVGEDVAVAGGACLVQQALDDLSSHVGFSLPCSGRGSDAGHVRALRCHRRCAARRPARGVVARVVGPGRRPPVRGVHPRERAVDRGPARRRLVVTGVVMGDGGDPVNRRSACTARIAARPTPGLGVTTKSMSSASSTHSLNVSNVHSVAASSSYTQPHVAPPHRRPAAAPAASCSAVADELGAGGVVPVVAGQRGGGPPPSTAGRRRGALGRVPCLRSCRVVGSSRMPPSIAVVARRAAPPADGAGSHDDGHRGRRAGDAAVHGASRSRRGAAPGRPATERRGGRSSAGPFGAAGSGSAGRGAATGMRRPRPAASRRERGHGQRRAQMASLGRASTAIGRPRRGRRAGRRAGCATNRRRAAPRPTSSRRRRPTPPPGAARRSSPRSPGRSCPRTRRRVSSTSVWRRGSCTGIDTSVSSDSASLASTQASRSWASRRRASVGIVGVQVRRGRARAIVERRGRNTAWSKSVPPRRSMPSGRPTISARRGPRPHGRRRRRTCPRRGRRRPPRCPGPRERCGGVGGGGGDRLGHQLVGGQAHVAQRLAQQVELVLAPVGRMGERQRRRRPALGGRHLLDHPRRRPGPCTARPTSACRRAAAASGRRRGA